MFCLFITTSVFSQTPLQWSERMASTVMTIWKVPSSDGLSPFPKWSYDEGVVWKGMEGLWKLTGNGNYFRYIQQCMDYSIHENGEIKGYKQQDYKLDDINNGKILLMLYRVTGKKKYWEAATLLRNQLRTQPRTYEGGFWHKKIYPDQMWLDGLYMAEPFYAEYAMLAHEGDSSFEDIAHQFMLMEKHARDPRTGLLYHGWDASKKQRWANPVTGDSPNFWSRAMGWYAMALVDALDYLPAGRQGLPADRQGFPMNNPYRDSLVQILNRLAAAVSKVQDPVSGCWWQVLDKGGDSAGNFLEASGSCMFVYALAKGVRKGYLPLRYLQVAQKGFAGIIKQFITTSSGGQLILNGTCPVAGLGGKPYRDGSYNYYISQKPVADDPKGIGAFIMAANEMEIASLQPVGKGKTVLLDNYFNHEMKKDMTGKMITYHYTWDDMANSGYAVWGNIFRYRGAKTDMQEKAPGRKSLSHANAYIIVDPDTKVETARPNYIEPKEADAIYHWVKKGGVLLLMANDSGNCEFTHLNRLAAKFGIHFIEDSKNHVPGHQFEKGAFIMPSPQPIFKEGLKVYLKEISTLSIGPPAQSIFNSDGDVIMAVSHVGKGTVFAVGDPWFYNEYTDGRKLPAEYENYEAACDLADWIFSQVKSN
ncbi:MAG: glycoside hydrolase family 88 protein [Chitinophagaceae bacterium]|nr:MAG: glycoside hydrolase family 88 protein [Chitinophagaceae bacterium]